MSDFEIRGTVEQKSEFFAAMALAQSQFRAVNKTRTVNVRSEKGSYSFDYAPLDEVFAATMPSLNANGFAVLQPMSATSDGVTLRLLITHAAGGELECSSSMARVGKMQEMGSQITYMRRYMYQSAVGVVAEEDDDGNAGDGNQRDVAQRSRQQPPQPPAKAKQVQVPDYRPQAQPVATPVPPKVAVSAPVEPSSAGGADVPKDVPGLAEQAAPQAQAAPSAAATANTAPTSSPSTAPAPVVSQTGTTNGVMTDDQRKEITALLHSKAWPDSAGKPFREKHPKTGQDRWAIVNTTRAAQLMSKVNPAVQLQNLSAFSDAAALLGVLRALPDQP